MLGPFLKALCALVKKWFGQIIHKIVNGIGNAIEKLCASRD